MKNSLIFCVLLLLTILAGCGEIHTSTDNVALAYADRPVLPDGADGNVSAVYSNLASASVGLLMGELGAVVLAEESYYEKLALSKEYEEVRRARSQLLAIEAERRALQSEMREKTSQDTAAERALHAVDHRVESERKILTKAERDLETAVRSRVIERARHIAQIDLYLLDPARGDRFNDDDRHVLYVYLLIPDLKLAGSAGEAAIEEVVENFRSDFDNEKLNYFWKPSYGAFIVPVRSHIASRDDLLRSYDDSFALSQLRWLYRQGGFSQSTSFTPEGVYLFISGSPLHDLRLLEANVAAWKAPSIELLIRHTRSLPDVHLEPVNIRSFSRVEIRCVMRLLRRDVMQAALKDNSSPDLHFDVRRARQVNPQREGSRLRVFVDALGEVFLRLGASDRARAESRKDVAPELTFADAVARDICIFDK